VLGLEFAEYGQESSDGARNDEREGSNRSSNVAMEALLFSDDPTAWEAALTRSPQALRTSETVKNEEKMEDDRSSGDGTNTRQGRGEMLKEILPDVASGHGSMTTEVTLESLHELDRIRSNLVSLRDAVQISTEDLHAPEEKGEQRTHHSWTVHSPAGCRLEEVRCFEAISSWER